MKFFNLQTATMKNNPVEAALKDVQNRSAELVALQKQAKDSDARLELLVEDADLADKAALTEIGHLQIFEALIPRRIAKREEAFVQAEADLLKTCHTFISEQHSPRVKELVVLAETRTAEALRPHFAQEKDLELAVSNSTLVIEVKSLSVNLEGRPFAGVTEYASRIMDASQRADRIAAQLS